LRGKSRDARDEEGGMMRLIRLETDGAGHGVYVNPDRVTTVESVRGDDSRTRVFFEREDYIIVRGCSANVADLLRE
jgi:hypothetical protein